MSKADYVFEVIMDEWPEFPGNALYDDLAYAKFCAEQDYKDEFYGPFLSGIEGAPEPGRLNWDFVCKGLYHMVEDDAPSGVAIKVRHVHSLGE